MMELNLTRQDYLQAGIIPQRCMQLLPIDKKEGTTKVVVGDSTGIVQLFSIKKNEPQHVFKTIPGPPISRLELAGPVGQTKDRVFVSSETTVRGYSKKGKQFLDFNTQITESIKNMYIEEADLFLCGNYIYHHYRDCKDINYYLCSDKINSVISVPSGKTPGGLPVIGCNDHVLRIMQNSEVMFQIPISGSPSTLCLHNNDGGVDGEELLYGTTDGRIGLVQVNRVTPHARWEIANEKQRGGVLCLDNYDIISDGVPDLLVGRDDGLIEVYGYNEADEPVLRFSHTCSESVTSIRGGVVASKGYDEVVCSTYAGWIFGLTTEVHHKSVSSDMPRAAATVSAAVTASTDTKIVALKKELDELQKKIQIERDRYQVASQNSKAISAVPKVNISDKFVLIREDASYTLSVELQVAIDNVLLQSDVLIDLLDVENNSAVVSFSACNPEDGNFLLATYRCQANTTRLELKVRTVEGQAGTIQAYVTPKLQPKTCQVRTFHIKPLSLHQRTNSFDQNRPLNRLQLTGNFTMAECHSWLLACLPELPERCPAGETATFYYISTFIGTMLECTYKRNEAVFSSDNISAISILKDVLSKEATSKGIRLNISNDVNEDSTVHILTLIHPKFEYQKALEQKVGLLEALKELQMHEPNTQYLSPEYQKILAESNQILAEYKRQPCAVERLYGTITDLYIDSYKFRGQNVRNKVQRLITVLENYSLPSLIEFFMSST